MAESDTCTRCKRKLGVNSVIPIKVEADRITLVHFFCGTKQEVTVLYGDPATFVFPIEETKKGKENK